MADVDLTQLPSDVDALRALLISTRHELVLAEEKTLALHETIAHLKQQLAELRRARFGRRSEKLDENIHQLELMIEDLEANGGEFTPTDADNINTEDKSERRRARRKPLPDHLPRDVIEHSPGDA